ncbi:condensation domain-containing protein [Actinophytocola sp.]|jgi:hypothetical protein|uniref:condensation domain-containing protein n=1 Tax=Actinophytocola sp. TaxID=1872138 RepID=UPI002ED855CB
MSDVTAPAELPATYYQRDWVLACQDGRSHFTTPLAWDLTGELDVDVLRAALRTLTGRHESLRTSFRVRGEDVCQVVWPAVEIDLRTVDLAAEGAVEARIVAETERPRAVSVAPLWHGLVFRLGRHRHVLALFVHHLVFDGWSHGVLHDELVRCYRSLVTGRTPRLPQLRLRPGDFARWERDRRDPELERWWRAELGALPPILPPPPVGGRFVSVALPPIPREAVTELAAAGFGASTALLAAVCAARRAVRGGDDVVVGVTRSGRERPQLQRIVGPLLDHVPVRVDLSGGPTFRELLARVHRSYRAAVEHRLPLGRIRQVVPGDLTARGGRLYDTRFNYLPASAARPDLGGPLTITPRPIAPTSLAPRNTEDHPEVLPLSYVLRQHPDGRLEGEICGPDVLFGADRLAGLAAEFAELVWRVGVAGLDRPLPVPAPW